MDKGEKIGKKRFAKNSLPAKKITVYLVMIPATSGIPRY